MAPTIPIDYTGQKESRKLSKKAGLGDMMGKTRKVSKGYSSGFVPDYRHAVETVAESECFGNSGRRDAGLNSLQDTCIPNGKCISLNVDGLGRSVVPFRSLSLSKMSSWERRDLEAKLKSELEQVRKLHRRIASFSWDGVLHTHTTDVHGHLNGPKRLAAVESLPLSTNDEPMTPGNKKGPPGRNGPRTKGGALCAKKTESVKQSASQNTSFAILMKQCQTLLTRLMGQTNAWIFNKPVDVVAHNVPEYYDVIKHPMDLGTTKSKLLSNQYSTPTEFAADVRLTFKNAMTFNPPKHEVHIMAEELSKFFEVRWKPIEKKLPPTADVSTASKSSVIIEPESTYVPPAKKQKTASKEPRVKQERDKPKMSDVEKQKLAVEMEELLEELPDNIINFLNESTQKNGEETDEIEIEIEALSDDTLFSLRKLLDDYLLEKKKKQLTAEHCQTEMHKESGLGDLSCLPCEENERVDDDVDIGGNDPPPMSSSSPIHIDKDAVERNSNCSGSRSSSSDSGTSSSDSENSSASEADGANVSVPAEVNDTADTQEEPRGKNLCNRNNGDILDANAEQYPVSSDEHNCLLEGESEPPDRKVSPDKLYRAALLRSRFADIIIKAQENTSEKGERPDPEKLKLEREELERRRKEEKARLQAEAKAAEEARKKAEAEAAAAARRKRELDREAARQALQQMEKTVDINDNSQFMEDLEMFRAAPDENLPSFVDEVSPYNSPNGLGSFKFPGNINPLEQLGLYMKNDEEDEEEVQPPSIPQDSNDTEEGEID